MAIARRERAPMIEQMTIPSYGVTALSALVSAFLVIRLGFSFRPEVWALFWSTPLIVVGGMLARRIHLLRTGNILEAVGLLYGQGFALLFAIYALAAISGSYADARLARWDQVLGFDWPGYVRSLSPLEPVLGPVYSSFLWQPALLAIALVVTGKSRRVWVMTCAAGLASLATAAVFPFFPAKGVYLFHHFAGAADPMVSRHGTWKFDTTMEYLRRGGRTVGLSNLTGLVSFPSFHAVEAVQAAWAAWGVRWLRWPLLALNIGVLVATPIIGAHYFVDVFAGIVIAIVSLIVSTRLVQPFEGPEIHYGRMD